MTFSEVYEEIVSFKHLEQTESNKRQECHSLENIQYNEWYCMFCGGTHPKAEFTKKAHAISETIGNKRLFNYLECQKCNLLFGKAFEDSLGKYTLPFRFVSHNFGKKNAITIKDMPKPGSETSYKSYRMEVKKHISDTQDSSSFDNLDYLIEQSGKGIVERTKNGFTLNIPRDPYNPRLVYAAFLKMAYSILPWPMIPGYLKCIVMLRQYAATETPFDDTAEAERYLSGMPHKGFFNFLPGINPFRGVNAYLYCKRPFFDSTYCNLFFRVDFYNFSITIPVLSDAEFCGDGNHSFHMLSPYQNGISDIIDFTKEEKFFRCEFSAVEIPIHPSQYEVIATKLREKGLLKSKSEGNNPDAESSFP